MPTGSLKDRLPQHLHLFVCHLALGLTLICTHDTLRWEWDWVVVDTLDPFYHLCLAAHSFAVLLGGLLVFGSAFILGVLPALVVIAIVEGVSRLRLPGRLPYLLFIGSLLIIGIGAWATTRWATTVESAGSAE
ncbi:hypothetical protein F4802DRAFT_591879 [Xylaria palmicola]|nr:hypothetical protein F4802DRAFT_591879 [Xylaria palmicola]